MEGAEDGVIVFSFGLQLNPRVIPPEVFNAIFGALAKVPQRIIARYKITEYSDSLKGLYRLSRLQ